jgi:hypothetical protein
MRPPEGSKDRRDRRSHEHAARPFSTLGRRRERILLPHRFAIDERTLHGNRRARGRRASHRVAAMPSPCGARRSFSAFRRGAGRLRRHLPARAAPLRDERAACPRARSHWPRSARVAADRAGIRRRIAWLREGARGDARGGSRERGAMAGDRQRASASSARTAGCGGERRR